MDSYETICCRIENLKKNYNSIRHRTDQYVFEVLVHEYCISQDPNVKWSVDQATEAICDGSNDGGIDLLTTHKGHDSDFPNVVIGQSKFVKAIQPADILDAMRKMVAGYKLLCDDQYASFNAETTANYQKAFSDVEDGESQVEFSFFTSAEKPRGWSTTERKIQKEVEKSLSTDKYEAVVRFYFAEDILRMAKEKESYSPTVKRGEILLDEANNYLSYDSDAAVIVNISALSLKRLFTLYGNNLLSQNLRYYIKKKGLDSAISDSMKPENSVNFWYKNNGVTITCDRFEIDGKLIRLFGFSIINGGQTAYLISQSNYVTEADDFFLPCKVIKNQGSNTDEKARFSFEIAQATNSQKAIQDSDLKSNTPEQLHFKHLLKEQGILYVLKRGEKVDSSHASVRENTNLTRLSKLLLTSVFQLPGSSRNRSKTIFEQKYYNPIYVTYASQSASLSADLLYFDSMWPMYLAKIVEDRKNRYGETDFAFPNNAKTFVLSALALSSRIAQKCIDVKDLRNALKSQANSDDYYKVFNSYEGWDHIFSKAEKENLTDLDSKVQSYLSKLLKMAIHDFTTANQHLIDDGRQPEMPTNYLKKDDSYRTFIFTNFDGFVDLTDEYVALFY